MQVDITKIWSQKFGLESLRLKSEGCFSVSWNCDVLTACWASSLKIALVSWFVCLSFGTQNIVSTIFLHSSTSENAAWHFKKLISETRVWIFEIESEDWFSVSWNCNVLPACWASWLKITLVSQFAFVFLIWNTKHIFNSLSAFLHIPENAAWWNKNLNSEIRV